VSDKLRVQRQPRSWPRRKQRPGKPSGACGLTLCRSRRGAGGRVRGRAGRTQKQEKAEKRRLMRRTRELQQARKRLERQKCLRDLRQLDPALFEDRIADLFNVQGYEAHAVGGSRDRGIDVVISRPDGTPWAVAQCKRYGFANRVSSSEIVHFCGAFHLSRAQCGFFFHDR
jgi:restriction system protein